jgi:hypothetical protein
MRTLRPISKKEMDAFITIFANAYPGIDVSSPELRSRFRHRMLKTSGNPIVNYFALFENEEMRGIMRLYDFTMSFLSSKALVRGVGGLAVDLLHKKEKVAADMLLFFLRLLKRREPV